MNYEVDPFNAFSVLSPLRSCVLLSPIMFLIEDVRFGFYCFLISALQREAIYDLVYGQIGFVFAFKVLRFHHVISFACIVWLAAWS